MPLVFCVPDLQFYLRAREVGHLQKKFSTPDYILIAEITHKIRTSFKAMNSRKAATFRLKNLRVKISFHEK